MILHIVRGSTGWNALLDEHAIAHGHATRSDAWIEAGRQLAARGLRAHLPNSGGVRDDTELNARVGPDDKLVQPACPSHSGTSHKARKLSGPRLSTSTRYPHAENDQ